MDRLSRLRAVLPELAQPCNPQFYILARRNKDPVVVSAPVPPDLLHEIVSAALLLVLVISLAISITQPLGISPNRSPFSVTLKVSRSLQRRWILYSPLGSLFRRRAGNLNFWWSLNQVRFEFVGTTRIETWFEEKVVHGFVLKPSVTCFSDFSSSLKRTIDIRLNKYL